MKTNYIKCLLVCGIAISGTMMPMQATSIFTVSKSNDESTSVRESLHFNADKKQYVQNDRTLAAIPNTFETWVRFDKAESRRQIIFGNYVYGKNSFALEITADNKLRWCEIIYEDGKLVSEIDYRISAPAIFDGNWQHIAFVRDVEKNAISFYQNGELKDVLNLDGTGTKILKDQITFDQIHYVGTDARKSHYLTADLSEIRLWDHIRSQDEIQDAMHQKLSGTEQGLMENWIYDMNVLNTNNDLITNKVQGGVQGQVFNFELPKARTSLQFKSAENSHAALAEPLKTMPKTIDFWAKLDKNPNKRQIILSNYIYGENGMGVELTADNQLRYVEFAYEGKTLIGNVDVRTSNASICDGKWAHFAIVRDVEGNKVEMYKDGEVLLSKALTGTGTDKLTEELTFTKKHYIGSDARAGNRYYLDGELDTLTLWNSAKSQEEIKALLDMDVTGEEIDLQHSWDFDYNSLSTADPMIHDKKENGIDAEAIHFNLQDTPDTDRKGVNFADGKTEIEMLNEFDKTPLTFETWLKMPTSAASARGGVIAGNLFDSYYKDIPVVNFEISTNGMPRLYWSINEKTYDYKATGINVCTNRWTHVAISYDQETKKMATYINGERVHEASMDFEPALLNQPLKIGKDSRKAYNFKGALSDLKIWSTTRTDAEIKENFDQEVAADADGLLGNWKLDEENVSLYKDRSIQQNHADSYWIDEDLFAKSEDGYQSIAVIPDTQTLAMSAPESFTTLTQWLKENKENLGIGAAIHVGDIVNERNSTKEWLNAKNSMDILNGHVPYVFSSGNHDVEIKKVDGVWFGTRNITMMNRYFPYAEMTARPTFGGSYEEGVVDNTYSYFTINGVKFMMISLEQSPREEVLAWANRITEENADKRVIVTTHEYLYYDGNPTTRETQDHLDFIGGSTTGQEMWDLYVKKHENIVSVIAGHVGYPDVISSNKIGDHGNTVKQILCDAQFMDRDDVNNGDGKGLGMVMLLAFKENSNDIQINWYSTVREQFYRSKNQYSDTMQLTVVANKENLQRMYEECMEIENEGYTETSWTTFTEAMEEAGAVLDNADAVQSDVDSAYDQLVQAKEGLVKEAEDTAFIKRILKGAIDKANAAETSGQLDLLAPEAAKRIRNARDEAIVIYEKAQATQDECLESWLRLADALHWLDFKADKALLGALIVSCEAINTDEYDEGVEAFLLALDTARTVKEDETALQERIDETYTNLENARDGLVKKAEIVKEGLTYILEGIKTKIGDGSAYKKDANWTALQEAITNAEEILKNMEATQQEVNEAIIKLTEAYENIRLLPSEEQLANLQDFVSNVNQMKRNLYMNEQLEQIDQLKEEVNAMIEDFDSKTYEALYNRIMIILEMMQEVEGSAVKDTEEALKPLEEQKIADAEIKGVINPKTGDTSQIGIYASMAALGGVGTFLLRKKRKS